MDTYGIIGDPVEHSLSPAMHEAAYEKTGINASYCLFRVKEGDVEQAVRGAKALGIKGLNVTTPHKETVAELDLVDLDERAGEIGAVNTLDVDRMRGYNTDATGAWRALKANNIEVEGASVAILGAGGAARAIGFELGSRDAKINIINRTYEKGVRLAEDLRKSGYEAEAHQLDLDDPKIKETIRGSDILVNATTVGMKENRSPVPSEYLTSELVVFDAVYTPLETRLLRESKEKGAKTIDGAWMLVYQGAEAFEIWTGKEAPVDAMNQAVRAELRG